MVKKRRHYSADDMFKVAPEAAKAIKTLAELASQTGFHPKQISQWKGRLLNEGARLFRRNGDKSEHEFEQRDTPVVRADRAPENGVRMAKIRLADSIAPKRAMIEPNHRNISLRRQCQSIGLHRSIYYYEPTGERVQPALDATD
jgi:putative transposase